MIITPDSFEQKIINTLNEVIYFLDSNNIQKNGEWTKVIKQKLADTGEEEGCEICASGFKDIYESEWLFDMVWYIEGENGKIKDVPLVVESEWGASYKHIKFDFEKLLVSNSRHRLMICQSIPANIESLKKYFYEAIQYYQLNQEGDRYLIAIFNESEYLFEFEIFIKEKQNKKMSEIVNPPFI